MSQSCFNLPKLFRLLLLSVLLGVQFSNISQASINKLEIVEKIKTASVPFIANQGQVDKEVSFYAKTLGGTLYVTHKGELVYTLPKIETTDSKHGEGKKDIKYSGGVVLREKLVNAKVAKVTAQREAVAKVNYIKGKDSNKWQSGVTTYEELSLGKVYEGIELRLKAYGDNVEKLFYVNPGADPNEIRLALTGAEKLEVLDSGELQASTRFGAVQFTKPVAWQEKDGRRVPVSVSYDIIQDEEQLIYAFQIGSYDISSSLTIDPLLASTYLGGANNDVGYSIALDGTGNVYVTGYSFSTDYPATAGSYDQNFNSSGDGDIIISKLSSDLSTLLASTYLGGANYDIGSSIALDSTGNVYVTGGYSDSTDYPTTVGAYDQTHNGGQDIIISKLSSDLSTLLASTYLGGANNEVGYSISLDSTGNVYVMVLASSEYPTTAGAYDQTYNGALDIIISKLSSDLSTLLASTYLGTANNEIGYSIALDSTGNVYVTGYSDSTDYPTTVGAYDQTHNGGQDVIISKLSSDLSTLLASTYLGGANNEVGHSIALDSTGNVYVAGYSYSTDYPTTAGAYDQTYNSSGDIIISKLSSDLSTLLASTYLGGANYDIGYSIALDSTGNACVTGYSDSTDYPTTVGAYDQTHNGGQDVIISKLSSDLSTLLASTYLGGGTNNDNGKFITLDNTGNVYVTGYSRSTDYPTTAGAYDQTHNGSEDVFISKFTSDLSASIFIVVASAGSGGSLDFDATVSPQFVIDGLTTQFTFIPENGHYIDSVSGCGDGILIDNTYTTGPITEDCTVTASFAINQYPLGVTNVGTGIGSIQVAPTGTTCGTNCYTYDHGDMITLTANPDVSSTFVGWSGDTAGNCLGIGTCTVTMDQARNVSADFTMKTFTLTVTAGANGSITPGSTVLNYGASYPLSISPEDEYYISELLVDGNPITPTTSYEFTNVTDNHTISATFAYNLLTVKKAGTGTGEVFSDVFGVNCGVDCSQPYIYNSPVTLTAVSETSGPEASTFAGWSGGGCSGVSPTCAVTMDQAKNITATFTRNFHDLTLDKAGVGKGTVASVPPPSDIECDASCITKTSPFQNGSNVTLRVISTLSGSTFTGWTVNPIAAEVSCFGTGDCTVTMADYPVTVTATFEADSGFSSNSKAIIVAGSGEDGGWLWDDIKTNAIHAFSVLHDQGYSKDNIFFLSSEDLDVDGLGGYDTDGDANLERLHYAITDWASDADDVLIYLIGHGLEPDQGGKFVLKNTGGVTEYLKPVGPLDPSVSEGNLNEWLEILQAAIYPGRVVLVYEACFSGHFISMLPSNHNRIIISSSADDEKSKFSNKGRLSFSYQFWSVIYEGAPVRDAFTHADAMMKNQAAWCDMNSDGLANQPISDVMPGNFFIGGGFNWASGDKPEIATVAPPQAASKEGKATLWAEVNYSGTVSEVWAVLTPPDYDPSAPDTPDELSVVPLDFSTANQRYQFEYDLFTKSGTYKVSYYAMNDAQKISLPESSIVKASGSFLWIFLTPILQAGQEK